MMKWIALLSAFACSSAFAQPATPDPIAAIRAQIMQHWFPVKNTPEFAVSFDLDRDGKLIGMPVVAAKSYDHGGSGHDLERAVMDAQPFFLLRTENYESWKHVTTNFTWADKQSTDIYAFTKKDILGVTTGMTEAAAKAALTEKGCRVSSPQPTALECTISTGDKLIARLTENMSPNVVAAVKYVFRSNAPIQEIARSISDQFHIRAFNRVWYLSRFSQMELNPYYDQERPVQSPVQSWALVMTEQRLFDQDSDALAEKQRVANPTPKL